MNSYPITLDTQSARDILFGRKTVTRRVVEIPKRWRSKLLNPDSFNGWGLVRALDRSTEGRWSLIVNGPNDQQSLLLGDSTECPYGKVGDTLWVREIWKPFMEGWSHGIEYRAGGTSMNITSDDDCSDAWDELTERTGADLRFPGANKAHVNRDWRSATDMPRWASQFTLKVLSIDIERLQDIPSEDVWAEGIVDDRLPPVRRAHLLYRRVPHFRACNPDQDPRQVFADAWDESWAVKWNTNPLVWRIAFERVETST